MSTLAENPPPYSSNPGPPTSSNSGAAVGLSGIYSQSGFDLLGIMSRVYHRPNPKVSLGNVDTSTAFTISNPRLPDDPIVYASESFTRLTGYAYNEVLGFNCRFLQAPSGPGSVPKGSDRSFTDSKVVYQMREHVNRHMECQFSLINYRKSGEPFINLITIVPLFAPGTSTVEFFVGFQVDLVEQPRAILNRCKEGNYIAGYRNADEHAPREMDPRGVIFDEIQNQSVVQHRNILTLAEDLCENVVDGDDFMFILSLRARFLFVSPKSCKTFLDYDNSELTGKKLQDFVHPADLLAVVRELRSSKAGIIINFMCRFKTRRSGFIYLDVTGHVYEGNSSNKKCFILSGRTVPTTTTPPIPCAPTVSDLWAKLSPQGLILFCSSENYPFFGLKPDNETILIGTQIHDLIILEDRTTFHQCLYLSVETKSVMECLVRIGESQKKAIVYMFPEIGDHARHIFVRFSPLPGPTDPPIGSSGCASGVIAGLLRLNDDPNSTSLHYEINQLKVQNKKLKEELGLMTDDVITFE
ncbi:UNVERIFIED_CONTAM: blue light receptor [Siphonaria sp. JEL0065]|nr:blue light receptor [Siphonaria sp. JEL0065]